MLTHRQTDRQTNKNRQKHILGGGNDEAAEAELSGCEAAKHILKERVWNKKKKFLVLFADGSRAWADFVTPTLLQRYRLLQDRQRQREQQRRRQRQDGRWRAELN